MKQRKKQFCFLAVPDVSAADFHPTSAQANPPHLQLAVFCIAYVFRRNYSTVDGQLEHFLLVDHIISLQFVHRRNDDKPLAAILELLFINQTSVIC